MNPDPLVALRAPEPGAVTPRPAFAAELRSRLVAALDDRPPPSPSAAPSSPTTTEPGGTAMPDVTDPATHPFRRSRYHTITPYLVADGARDAMAFYAAVFGAVVEGEPIVQDDGRIGHVELRIGDSLVELADEFPEMDILGPRSRGGHSVTLTTYVPDVDAAYARAVELGATGEREPADQFYGARTGVIVDPWGHRWSIQTPLPETDDLHLA